MKLSDLPKHHALLLVTSERESASLALHDELKSISPAHRFFNQTVLDIDTARNIISWSNTPYNEERIGLISFHTAGVPAQNAMLKVLEEPREGVRFILITSNKDNLIETVLSRVQVVQPTTNDQRPTSNDDADLFLETKPTARIKLPFVTELLSREDEEGRKDREALRAFLLDLIDSLKIKKNIKPKYIEETIEMSSYAGDPSSSGKAILEYLALLLPQTKN